MGGEAGDKSDILKRRDTNISFIHDDKENEHTGQVISHNRDAKLSYLKNEMYVDV